MPITEVLSCTFVGLVLQNRMFNLELNLMQASFTAQADGTYARHNRTRQEPQRVEFAAGFCRGNALLAHLRSAFLGHFLLKPGVNVDQK